MAHLQKFEKRCRDLLSEIQGNLRGTFSRSGGKGVTKKPTSTPKRGDEPRNKAGRAARQDRTGNRVQSSSQGMVQMATLQKLVTMTPEEGVRSTASALQIFAGLSDQYLKTKPRKEVSLNAVSLPMITSLTNSIREGFRWVVKRFDLCTSEVPDCLKLEYKGTAYCIDGYWEAACTYSMGVEDGQWKVIYLERVPSEEAAKWHGRREALIDECGELSRSLEDEINAGGLKPAEVDAKRRKLALKLELKVIDLARETSGLVSCMPSGENAEHAKGLISAADLRNVKNLVRSVTITAMQGGKTLLINGDTMGIQRKQHNADLAVSELTMMLNLFWCTDYPQRVLSAVGTDFKLKGENVPLLFAVLSHLLATPGESGKSKTCAIEPLSMF